MSSEIVKHCVKFTNFKQIFLFTFVRIAVHFKTCKLTCVVHIFHFEFAIADIIILE